MGYTHYWEQKEEATRKEVAQVLKEIRIMHKTLPAYSKTADAIYGDEELKLCGGGGTGAPEFNKDGICFNGDETKNHDHETFAVNFNSTEFEFCKTARKPYDMMACLCLLSLENNIPSFSYSSDGDKGDWKPAVDFYRKHIGPVSLKLKS
jgi:hypothetical protein